MSNLPDVFFHLSSIHYVSIQTRALDFLKRERLKKLFPQDVKVTSGFQRQQSQRRLYKTSSVPYDFKRPQAYHSRSSALGPIFSGWLTCGCLLTGSWAKAFSPLLSLHIKNGQRNEKVWGKKKKRYSLCFLKPIFGASKWISNTAYMQFTDCDSVSKQAFWHKTIVSLNGKGQSHSEMQWIAYVLSDKLDAVDCNKCSSICLWW